MPSSVNYDIELSLILHFRRSNAKWRKRTVALRKCTDIRVQKYDLIICKTFTRPFSRIGSTEEIKIIPHSHIVIKDVTEDKKSHLLCLVPINSPKEQEPYLFASHGKSDLDNLANAIEKLCPVSSFEVSIDSEHSQFPTGAALLHIWKHNACLTSKNPVKVFKRWQLVEPLKEFQWERNMIHVQDSELQNSLFDLFVRACDVKKIQMELDRCKELCHCENKIDDKITALPQISFSRNSSSTSDEQHTTDNKDTKPIRTKSFQSSLHKENVEIRFPGPTQPRRCKSETSLRSRSYKEEIHLSSVKKTMSLDREYIGVSQPTADIYSNKNPLPLRENLNSRESNINLVDCNSYYKNVQLRPTYYIYTNAPFSKGERHDPSNTYVNIFSGSSFKGCYENWEHQSSIYSTLPQVKALDAPPLPPRPSPPMLPPKNHGLRVQTPPPPLPPRSKDHLSLLHRGRERSTSPRIHVAVFTSTAIIGRVWFLRVVFMHQDDKDSTLKRVTDIELLSNHTFRKSQCLKVSSHLSVTVTPRTEGFQVLNDNKQAIELSDIDNLRKGDWFVIEFHIQNCDKTKNLFLGNVSIDPKSSDSCCRTCKAEMGIDEVFETKVMQSSSNPAQYSLLTDYNKRKQLCRALDITVHSQCHDWRQVAGSLGFTHAEILELQDKACRSVTFSPTDEVLKMWEQREPSCTVEKLVNVLREIGRLDVVQDMGYSFTLES